MNPEFPATRWSVIAAARSAGDTAGVRTALNELCGAYWYPLYAFARRRGLGPEDAEDATQAFFLRILDTKLFAAADPALGRLRSFLLRAFSRDLADHRRETGRQKRGGGLEFVHLDSLEAESRYLADPTATAPETHFEADWAAAVLAGALARLELDYANTGRSRLFQSLRPWLGYAPPPPDAQARIAEALGLRPAAFRQALARFRDRFRTALRSQIADTLSEASETAIDEEIQALRSCLSQSALPGWAPASAPGEPAIPRPLPTD